MVKILTFAPHFGKPMEAHSLLQILLRMRVAQVRAAPPQHMLILDMQISHPAPEASLCPAPRLCK